jgi:hypothetical protein
MYPTDFDQSNQVIDKPPDMTREECLPINAFIGESTEGYPAIVTCWKPTKEELEEINRTGRVWCILYSHVIPPHYIAGSNPFDN